MNAEESKPRRPLAHPMAIETWREDYLRTESLKIDVSYQRKLDAARVNRMAAAWSDARCLLLEVNQRPDGTYWVMNGQHRLAAAHLAGVEWLPCRIYTFPTVALEALWFAGQAQDTRAVPALDRMKARIVGLDARAVAIEALARKYGYTFNWAHGNSQSGTTRAAAALEELYRRNPNRLEYLLHIISASWGDAPNACSDTTLHALWFFTDKYSGIYDRQRLITVLSGSEPNVLRQRAYNRAQLAGGGSAERHMCEMIAEMYDKGKRTGRLRPQHTGE